MTPPQTPALPPFDIPLDVLRRRTSVKWRTYDADVLPLWVAEMDVLQCAPVAAALADAIAVGDTGYGCGNGVARAYAAFAERRWGWAFDPDTTVTVPDVMVGIVELLRVLTEAGDTVVINSPVYPPFTASPESIGRRIERAPLTGGGRIDLDALDAAFSRARRSGRPVVYLLCNPHNPTGVAHTPAELADALALASRHRVRVVADEIHAPIESSARLGEGAWPGSRPAPGDDAPHHTPLLTVPGSDSAIVVVSASKAWNLAALREAVIVGGPAAAEDLARIRPGIGDGVSHLASIAHEAALTGGEGWLDQLLVAIDANKDLLADLLGQYLPGARYRRPEGTYLAWLDCRGLPGVAGEAPGRFFLHAARVALNDGETFGPGGEGHVRLNLGTNPEIIASAVERMGKAVAALA